MKFYQSLRKFEIFTAVARQQSFTKAAKQLALSKAAVSVAIKAMEDELKVPLFFRTTRQLQLSPEGERIFQACDFLMAEVERTEQVLKGLHPEPAGTLRISCNPYLMESHLQPILARYLAAFPKVHVELFIEERMPDMMHEKIDLVFGVNWPAPDEVIAKKIASTRYVLCASPDYFVKNGIPLTLADLANHNYIPHMGRSENNFLIGSKQTLKQFPQTRIKVNHAGMMKELALQGWGIIQLHDYMVQKELSEGKLIEILATELTKPMFLYVYYHKFRFVQPKIKQFLQFIDEEKSLFL